MSKLKREKYYINIEKYKKYPKLNDYSVFKYL